MRKYVAIVVLAASCQAATAADFDRSAARADVYASASMTAGIETEAALNLRFNLLDPATRTTQDQGDLCGWIELRNLSFRLRQDSLAGPAKPGDSPTTLNNIQGQFGGNVADWLGNKPFVFDARVVYSPYPYTWKLYATLFSQVAQTGEPIPGTGLGFNKAEAVTSPLFKTYTGVKLLGEVLYEGLDTGGLVVTFEGEKLKAALKAFSHNDTPSTAHVPAWLDHADTAWAVGADLRWDFLKDWTYVDTTVAYDFDDPARAVNAGVAAALAVPLGWGPVVGFQVAPSSDLRWRLADDTLAFDARVNFITLLSDANKDDQATMLMASAYLGDDRDIEYAVIFSEPLAGGWVDDVEFGAMLSAMDILGNNPDPLPGITQDYGPSSQYGASVGVRLGPKDTLKLEAYYQTGLAAYFASANEDGLLLADATDRAKLVLTWTNTWIPNTKILAT
jgi:hypothetical protein